MTSNYGISTYHISKYSRQISQSSVDIRNAPNGGEWEHRSGSGLRVLLERTPIDNGGPDGLVLRVVQGFSSTSNLISRSNILEEVNITALQNARLNSTPLIKVVYQETRVGVRYLYQNDEPKESIFRRFQVTFASPSDATVLIEAIRGYCICTPARGNESQKPPSMLPPPVVPSTTSSRVPLTATNHQVTPEESAVQSYEKALEKPLSHPSISPSVQQAAPNAIVGTNLGPIPTHAHAAQPQQSYSKSTLVTSVYPLESQTLLSSTGQTQASQFSVQMSNVALQRSSESSPIASFLHPPTWSDPPGASSTPPAVPSSSPVGSTIASVAELYQLPVEELESAVADILREPGFDEFAQVGKLDKMWALHGFFKR